MNVLSIAILDREHKEGIPITYRAFISVPIEPNGKILSLMEELKRSEKSLKVVDAGNLHVTLKFLGDTDPSFDDRIVQAIERVVDGRKIFGAQLRGMGVFPSEKYIKVIWLGVDSSGILEEISSDLNNVVKKLGFRSEKNFKGHLTLARVNSARGKKKITRLIDANRDTRMMFFPVEAIHLMKSTLTPQGPIYEVVRRVPLQSPDDGVLIKTEGED